MTSFPGKRTGNAVPFSVEEVPVWPVGSWRRWILETCKDAGRIVSLFALRGKGETLRLFGVLGIDEKGEFLVAAADLGGTPPSYPALYHYFKGSHFINIADLGGTPPSYPALTPDLPQASLFERELAEKYGVRPEGHPWLKPVRKIRDYPFYKMEGEEVHEVAVGPVHAGIIEPGHFRFQCHGEKVFHLEIQLGYQHRGVESLMVSAKPSRRMVLTESIAGDTVIGHGLAYCQAMEGLCGLSVSHRAEAIRAVSLELERLANHAGDLGALSQDIGYLPASAYFGRLRGEFLNLLTDLSGNRYGRSLLRPGGVLFDFSREMIADFKKRLGSASRDMKEVADLFFSSSMVMARLEHAGVVPAKTARELGLVGFVARASNVLRDVRRDFPKGAYRFHYIPPVKLASGDVYARARIRSLEAKKSLEFILDQLESLTPGKIHVPCEKPFPSSLIVSLVEGWRGEIAHVGMTDEKGEISGYKIVDPSFHNWVALEMALRDGQISDFPLCNKSFNLSYAGHDL